MIHPTYDHILVKIDDKSETTTSSGLILSAKAKVPQVTGEVIETGPHSEYKKGHKVVIKPFNGYEMVIDGASHRIVTSSDIIAILA